MQPASPSSSSGAVAAVVKVITGTVATNDDNNAVGAVVPPSSTKDKDAYVGASVVFKGACVGAFMDGAGPLGNNNNVKSVVGEGSGGGSSTPGVPLVAPKPRVQPLYCIVLPLQVLMACRWGLPDSA